MRNLTSPRLPYYAVALGLALVPRAAFADEPRSATEPRVMEEPGEVTNVIDAFEENDPFDLNISLGFQYATKSAKIRRETSIAAPGLTTGGFTSQLMNVAQYSESTSRLVPRVDIGLYHDLALYIKLPIILSNSQKLEGLDGTDDPARQSVVLAGAPGEQLFKLPFKSPDRSGVENLTIGLEADLFNQARDHSKPTWLVGLEGRFSIGTPMHACNANPPNGEVDCADPTDVNRNGQTDPTRDASGNQLEGQDANKRSAGITRGTTALELHTLLSRRVKYVEPYGGFTALFEFQNSSSDYGVTDLEGSLVNHPPLVGTMIVGMMIIPWEHRERFSRLTIDARFMGQYHSEGRDYSELFDALGSSDASSLRQPQWAKYTANPAYNPAMCTGTATSMCPPQSIIDQSSQKTYFTGLADVQAYASWRASASLTWQAGEYVKLTLGGGFRHDQAHGISNDQPCNPDIKDDIKKAGPCHSGNEQTGAITATGIPNPNYRPTINSVGRRFFVDDSNTFDVFATGVVMF